MHLHSNSTGLCQANEQGLSYLKKGHLQGHLEGASVNNLLPQFQSAYRPHHSVETAVVKVLADILLAIDRGDLAGLALLDLSTAFDTVDHDVLLQRLDIVRY